MRKKVLFCLPLILAISGCTAKYADVPAATRFEQTKQKKMQSASHWNVVADDVSKKLMENLAKKANATTPIYVRAAQQSSFSTSMTTDVIKNLTHAGYKVIRPKATFDGLYNHKANTAADVVTVEINTQVLKYNHDRAQRENRKGVLSLLTTGLWAFSAFTPSVGSAATAGVFAIDGNTWLEHEYSSGETPKTEIIVDISAFTQNEYMAVSKGIYYLASDESNFYEDNDTMTYKLVEGH